MARGTTKIDTESIEARRRVSIARLLHDAFSVTRDHVLDRVAARGHTKINMSHSLVLRHIDVDGTPLSVITRRAGVSRQAVAKVAQQLEALGYLTAEVDALDRRGKVLTLTRKGLRLFSDSLEAYDAFEGDLAELLGRRQLEQFRKTLQLIAAMGAPNR